MANYAAFLRAVNLGSQRKVSSAQLRALFEELGLEEVDVFRTSGNVAFGARREPVAKLTARIEKGLAAALGFDVMIFLRTAGQVRAIAEHEPFPAGDVEASKGKLQVVLLPKPPASGVRDE